MTEAIIVPKTIGQAKKRLAAIAETRRLSGWERAAIVWAHTNSDRNKSRLVTPSGATSIPDLAEELGLGRRTIDRARSAWKTAMEKHGAPDIKPGEAVPQSILGLDYPPTEETDGTEMDRDERGARAVFEKKPEVAGRLVREHMAKNPEVVAEAVKAVPAVAEAVVKTIVRDDELEGLHDRAWLSRREDRSKPTPRRRTDAEIEAAKAAIPDFSFDKDVLKALRVIDDALKREARGEWKPGPGTSVIFTLLYLNLKERHDGIEASRPPVFKEIDDYLATTARKEE